MKLEKMSLFERPYAWRKEYHYSIYDHKLMMKDGITYTRSFIVVKNKFNVIVYFTILHRYVDVYENKVFVPITSNARVKSLYICMMLNYVLLEHYDKFKIDHVFRITKESLECFFRDYAQDKLTDGRYRSAQSVERCVNAVICFFGKLSRAYGKYVLLTRTDLYTETTAVGKHGRQYIKRIPAFQVRGVPSMELTFRELPTKVFKILLNKAFRYTLDIAFAICMQAFAGLRAGEVLNVRQEGSPKGSGLIFTQIEGRTVRAEIDLTKELPMRSDGIVCGKIKKERKQSVYTPFLNAFIEAYDFHKKFLSVREFEQDYCPMFINKSGMAMTYDSYRGRFKTLIDEYLRPELIASDDPECRIYGQLLYENHLGTHSLRHWYTTQLVLNGEDIAQVQYWRGDKNPESAFVYLQNKGDLLRELESCNDLLAEVLMKQGELMYDETE